MPSNHLARLESWVLEIITRAKSGSNAEDARVELKREWPNPEKASRRLAGHANASFGSQICWVIGVDETHGVIGAQPQELSNWWQATRAYFDGEVPSLTDLAIQVDGKTVIGLIFDTSRPPYVTKNPKFGQAGGGPVSLEVPWREGTSVGSASRNNLLRVLSPTITLPEIEVLRGSGTLTNITHYPDDNIVGVKLSFTLSLYLVPRSDSALVVPFHRCSCEVVADGTDGRVEDFEITMYRPSAHHGAAGFRSDSATMERTSSELIAMGPGKCSINATAQLKETPAWLKKFPVNLKIRISVIDAALPVNIDVHAKLVSPGNNELLRWKIDGVG